MVVIKSLMIAVIVAIAPVAQAGACKPGLSYCYNTLVDYDYDAAKLKQAADLMNLPADKLMKTKYRCNKDGSVTGIMVCGKLCIDAGRGNNDFCF
ncbi:hypothetical protein E4U57_002438 [Claviceps arundinis]|uniref:Uncharacterized protein n=1 Tax=Claviceps arundinis TaxID=1623583 RepID=A0ABQ7PNH9_9HYPO|nr:hypothetical protein E4U57_002438 [Claviceps arundinis]